MDPEVKAKLVVDVNSPVGDIQVFRRGDRYDVYCKAVLRHRNCSAEDVIRALGAYLHASRDLLR